MENKKHHFLIYLACSFLLTACATYGTQKVGPTGILQATEEIPEEQLLDVGIQVFESDSLTEEEAADEGTHPEIRKAESHFIPYHLKNTLQQSSQWGAVRVIPSQTDSVDITVKGKIIESNGERLAMEIEVVDATGEIWLTKTYWAEATETFYSGNRPGEKDAFQNIYNAIANDMAEFKTQLSPAQIEEIRTVSKLKFAQDFAPDAFNGYLRQDKESILSVNRLPADEEPMMDRLLRVREREYMYVDTLNQYYEGFYHEMWPSYENWRKMNLTEQKALKKIKREAIIRQIAGALLMAGAAAMAVGDNSGNTRGLQAGMIIVGGEVLMRGFNISKEAEIHAAAIRELSESFGSEMQPVVMEFQGKRYELTGSAEAQFQHWRELLRKIYFTETGFVPDEGPVDPELESTQSP